jgi:hypothetical protein
VSDQRTVRKWLARASLMLIDMRACERAVNRAPDNSGIFYQNWADSGVTFIVMYYQGHTITEDFPEELPRKPMVHIRN